MTDLLQRHYSKMEEVRTGLQQLNAEIAELCDHQISALLQRDKEREIAIEDKIAELTILREHLITKVAADVSERDEREKASVAPLVSLLYVSSWAEDMDEGKVAQIGLHASIYNQKHFVTGFLLYIPNPGLFIQCLEGPYDTVESLFGRIALDKRHSNVTLVSRLPLENRRYTQWAMQTRVVDEEPQHSLLVPLLAELLAAYSVLDSFCPPSIRDLVVCGYNPFLVTEQREEAIVGFIGLVDSALEPSPSGDDSELFAQIGLVCDIAYNNVSFANGTCFGWLGEGMYFRLPADAPNGAIECALTILQQVAQDTKLGDGVCRIGLDVGPVIRTICGDLKAQLMPTVIGPSVEGALKAFHVATESTHALLITESLRAVVSKVRYTLMGVKGTGKDTLHSVSPSGGSSSTTPFVFK